MRLKQYQTDTLDALRRFLEEARVAGPRAAYDAITGEPEQAARLGPYGGSYAPLDALPDVPYICLRLPTGGGKTILGAYSVGVARDAWVEKDHPMVLWLVPSNVIRRQTAEALKNTRHPYRQALDGIFDGRVRVFDIADFTHLRPQDVRDNCCIVVGTIQTLRVENTEGRKVYAHNEDMEPHFSTLSNVSGLEQLEGGGAKFSFANLLHLHRPLMIVDEAHNAVTGLTRDMQARVNPCAIIEFTATPMGMSNILHSVTAQELKDEGMIKLPIMLSECETWQNAVGGAIAQRASLAAAAGDDRDYIRPIVLFQAQPRNRDLTAEVLRRHLIETENIPEDRIAVATGNQRELDDINLFDPGCPVEHVITVEALKEGWDCSFAYVLCSVSRIQNARDVEQLLGRVLRMPYARRREAGALNRAYAFLSEAAFGDAARSLVDKLIKMGFDEAEAQNSIEPTQRDLGGGLFVPQREDARPAFRHSVEAGPEAVTRLKEIGGDLSVREVADGRVEIEVGGYVDEDLEASIVQALPAAERESIADAVARHREQTGDQFSPAERGKVMRVPRLMTVIQGQLELADTDTFMEFHDWSLQDHPASLGEDEFAIRDTARNFEINLDGNRITYQYADATEQRPIDGIVEGWTSASLAAWLDRQVRQPDISQGELLRWLSDLLHYLTTERRMDMAALVRCKFILARKVRQMIDACRQQERGKAHQKYLIGPDAKPEVSFDHAFEFKRGTYAGERRYRGAWKPGKNLLGDFIPAFDGADDGEEFRCAQAIDKMSAVQYWVRNVARNPGSFHLPTARGRFYPDFVAWLKDGRMMAIEYKGAHIVDSLDTAEKKTVGHVWEKSSGGKCLFVMIEQEVEGADMQTQLLNEITASQ